MNSGTLGAPPSGTRRRIGMEGSVSWTSQGDGWWRASDGLWYPPEKHPDRTRRRSGDAPSTTAGVTAARANGADRHERADRTVLNRPERPAVGAPRAGGADGSGSTGADGAGATRAGRADGSGSAGADRAGFGTIVASGRRAVPLLTAGKTRAGPSARCEPRPPAPPPPAPPAPMPAPPAPEPFPPPRHRRPHPVLGEPLGLDDRVRP